MKIFKPYNILILTTLILLGCTHKGGFSSSDESVSSSESYIEPSSSEDMEKYDELSDSVEGIDATDLSALYSTFNNISSYKSEIKSYFNDVALYDYYRHFQKNYVYESASLVSEDKIYSYTLLPDLFSSLNEGYINKNNNYYRFSLPGNNIEERLAYQLTDSDLTLVKESSRYQDDMFLLDDLNEAYFKSKNFTRISEKKYQTIEIDAFEDFASICAPNLINSGHYMTFSRATIELEPTNDIDIRIRLYASITQRGKMIESHKDETGKPNWYLLFSEASIYL